MHVRLDFLIAAAMLMISPAELAGQVETLPIPLDSRVRVTTRASPGHEFVGNIDSWDGTSLGLSQPEYETQTVPLSYVVKLEISRGRKGNAGTGAWIGTVAGLVAGVIAAIVFEPENDAYGLGRIAIVTYSTLAGAGVGTLTGALIKTEKWEEVPLPASTLQGPPVVARD